MKVAKMPFGEFALVQPSVPLERGTEYPFIAMEDVEPFCRTVRPGSERNWDGGGGARFENGDVLFARITPCLEHGKTAQVQNLPSGAGFGSTEFFVFRGREGVSDSRYIYYLACSDFIREPAIKSMVGASGRQRAQRSVIEETKVPAPSLPVQQRIADILSAYDDLIENNRRRMALLEDAARQLYREWFVRLRFPGHEHTPITNGVPEGWGRKKLADVADINRESLSNKFDGEIEYIDIASVTPGQINETTIYEFRDAPSRARRAVRHGDIIWSCVRPNRRSHCVIWNPAPNLIASTGFAVITPRDLPTSYLYQAVTTDAFVGYLENHARGAAYPAVVAGDFERATIIVPTKSIVNAFNDFAEPLLDQIQNLRMQNQKLRAARDVLLPRLMNGEIAV